MNRVIYNCMVCNGIVSTDGDYTCTCPHPTAPPLQSAHELAGNGAGHDAPVMKNRLELDPVEDVSEE